jgi:hypothetical protein
MTDNQDLGAFRYEDFWLCVDGKTVILSGLLSAR